MKEQKAPFKGDTPKIHPCVYENRLTSPQTTQLLLLHKHFSFYTHKTSSTGQDEVTRHKHTLLMFNVSTVLTVDVYGSEV